jgi:arsenate reductase-like glutaredoxin family protein
VTPTSSLDDFEATLRQIATLLARLAALYAEQCDAVARDDLQTILRLTVEQEQAGAHLAQLEEQRAQLQTALLRASSTDSQTDLRALVRGFAVDPPRRERLLALLDEVGLAVAELRRHHARTVELLRASAELAQRSRLFLMRLTGAEPAYQRPILYQAPSALAAGFAEADTVAP